jgi:hypothetical protein
MTDKPVGAPTKHGAIKITEKNVVSIHQIADKKTMFWVLSEGN